MTQENDTRALPPTDGDVQALEGLDDAVLNHAHECCLAWEPDACLIGNVTARQLRQIVHAAKKYTALKTQVPVSPDDAAKALGMMPALWPDNASITTNDTVAVCGWYSEFNSTIRRALGLPDAGKDLAAVKVIDGLLKLISEMDESKGWDTFSTPEEVVAAVMYLPSKLPASLNLLNEKGEA